MPMSHLTWKLQSKAGFLEEQKVLLIAKPSP